LYIYIHTHHIGKVYTIDTFDILYLGTVKYNKIISDATLVNNTIIKPKSTGNRTLFYHTGAAMPLSEIVFVLYQVLGKLNIKYI